MKLQCKLFNTEIHNDFPTNYENKFSKCSELKNNINDEIYTPKNMVEAMLDPHIDYLKEKNVLLPCDQEWSEFVKYMKKNNITHTHTQDTKILWH